MTIATTLWIYREFVQRLFKNMDTPAATTMHAAVGVAGEAGEILGAVKKHWVYNKPLDAKNLKEELGDLFFYMQKLMTLQNWTLEEILKENMEKLRKRFPGGYSDQAAQIRADKLLQPKHSFQDHVCEGLPQAMRQALSDEARWYEQIEANRKFEKKQKYEQEQAKYWIDAQRKEQEDAKKLAEQALIKPGFHFDSSVEDWVMDERDESIADKYYYDEEYSEWLSK